MNTRINEAISTTGIAVAIAIVAPVLAGGVVIDPVGVGGALCLLFGIPWYSVRWKADWP